MFLTKAFSRGFTLVLAAALAFGLAAFTAGFPTLATPAHANGLTITKKDGNSLAPQGTTCAPVTPGTPCVAYYSGETGPILELAYIGSLNIEQIANTSGNLTIQVFGETNVIGNTDMTGKTALSVAGDLTVLGKTSPAKLMIDAKNGNAISLSGESDFNVGDDNNSVILQVTEGSAPSADEALVASGSEYILPAGPGPGPGPGPATPGTFMVGDVTLVNNGVKTDTGVNGVTIEKITIFDLEFWQVTFDGTKGPFDPITIRGGEGFHFGAANGTDVVINSTVPNGIPGLSINAQGENSGIVFISDGSASGDFLLAGGIATNDTVRLDGVISVIIGSTETRSPFGVEVGHSLYAYNAGATGQARLEIYTSGVGITAAPQSQPSVQAQSNGVIVVDSMQNVTSGFVNTAPGNEQISVANGGVLNFTYATDKSLGIDHAYSEVGTLSETNECITESTQVGSTYVAANDTNNVNTDVPGKRYKLTTSATTYNLVSTAPGLVNLSWEQGADTFNPVTGGQVCVLASRGQIQIDQGRFFSYMIEEGSDVTIKLLPEHENQFLSGEFTVAGPPADEDPQLLALNVSNVAVNPIVANAAEYSFTMPPGNIQLSTVFESVPDDPAIITATDVTSASVGGSPTAVNGNAELEISEGEPSDEADFMAVAGTRIIATYLDVSVEQVIEQGDTSGQWTQTLEKLNEPVEISMELDSSLRGFSEYQVIREHEGTVEPVPSIYDPATGLLTFETDRFSTYAIAHGPKVTNPFTFDPGVENAYYQAWASGLALLTLLGGALLWRKLSVN